MILEVCVDSVESAVNAMVRTLNALSFEVPKWVPSIGGTKFSLGLKTVDLPNIPYLAQGAVLPPNQPFLAVVGDQRSGTNVEAPLTTIQEAVAAVMTDVVEAELAGHNATVGVLTQILEAVLGIHLDENAIGAAADRYNARQRMITGGF